MTSNLLAAAISGIVFGAGGLAHAEMRAPAAPVGDDSVQLDDADKHACKGQNQCKGHGGCKTDKHACKGQNQCKGQGGCKTDSNDGGDKHGK